jgi:hypothetical protein
MAKNSEYLESARKSAVADVTGEALASMMLGPDVPTIEEQTDPFVRYIRWEQVAVFALLQRKRALLSCVVEHLEDLDPEDETDHPSGCGDDRCAIVTKEGMAGELVVQILSGQMADNIIAVPEGMSPADVMGMANGNRLADEVEAYVRDHGEEGYL